MSVSLEKEWKLRNHIPSGHIAFMKLKQLIKSVCKRLRLFFSILLCSPPASAQWVGPRVRLPFLLPRTWHPESLQAVRPLSVHTEALEPERAWVWKRCIPSPEPPGPSVGVWWGPLPPRLPESRCSLRRWGQVAQPTTTESDANNCSPSPSELWKENLTQLPLLILVNKIWNRDIKNELCSNYTPVKT